MWAGMAHLFFGNALIGIGEGALLARFFSVPKGKAFGLMIPANYFSAWIGVLFVGSLVQRVFPIDLNNGWLWFWVMVAVTYCLTLLLEWPFVAWCFRGTPHWLGSSIRANFLVQSASYIVIFGWYWMASGTSLYTQMHIVAPSELSLPNSVIVYYISAADGDVYQRPLSHGNPSKVFDLHSANGSDRLFMRPSAAGAHSWDLVARLYSQNYQDPRFVVIETNMTVDAAPNHRGATADPIDYENGSYNIGEAPRLDAVKEPNWEFRSGFWAMEGFSASNEATGKRVQFSYETPFKAWAVRNAVQVTPDQALFQLGDDQICAFDPASRRVALLWRGRGPAAVIPLSNASQPAILHE